MGARRRPPDGPGPGRAREAEAPQGSLPWAGFTPVRQILRAVRVELDGSFLWAVRLVLTLGPPVHAWSTDELAVLAD